MSNKQVEFSNERLLGLSPLCRENLLLLPRLVVVSGYGHPKQIWVLGTLEENQQEYHLPAPTFCGATAPSKLFALAFSILRLCCKASLTRAKTFLRTQWYQYRHILRL